VLALVERAGEAVEELFAVAPRLGALLADAERLVGDIGALLERIEATRAEADEVVARTDATRARADALLTALEPPLTALQPTLDRLAETTDPREVDALVVLVDQLPLIAEQVEGDVIPVMRSLRTVAPDVHDLLDLTRELNGMLAKVPGMGRIKKRVDEQQAGEAAGQ
jgi:ABC-type transporter Mla subunit MlaD